MSTRILIEPKSDLTREALELIPKYKRGEVLDFALFYFLGSKEGRQICAALGIDLSALPFPEQAAVPRSRVKTAPAQVVAPIAVQAPVPASVPGAAPETGPVEGRIVNKDAVPGATFTLDAEAVFGFQ